MSPADLRKGWCPGALRPMAARDGLLVRLRIAAGVVPAATARTIAALAERYGNGHLDLSARANLQIRGVSEATLPFLLDGLAALDLLDEHAEGEAVRNVLCSPLAALVRDGPDLHPLATALEATLVADRALHALPPKFGFLLDDGTAPSLAGVAADLRFEWLPEHGAFAVGFGGTAATALPLGSVPAAGVVTTAIALARRCLCVPGSPRRARTMLQDMGRDAVASLLGTVSVRPAGAQREPSPATLLPGHRVETEAADVTGVRDFAGVTTLGLAAPFGRLDVPMLRDAAAAAESAAGELRLTPWRVLLVPRPTPATDLSALRRAGFIVDPTDPRLRVAACTGIGGCERGTTDTHADAAFLAPFASSLIGDVALHVSGCAKGCARPRRTTITLVGRDGRYDLLRDGRPGDTPDRRDLDLDAVRAILDAA